MCKAGRPRSHAHGSREKKGCGLNVTHKTPAQLGDTRRPAGAGRSAREETAGTRVTCREGAARLRGKPRRGRGAGTRGSVGCQRGRRPAAEDGPETAQARKAARLQGAEENSWAAGNVETRVAGGGGAGVSWGGPGQGPGAAGAASSSSSTKLGHGTCQAQVAEFTKSSGIQGRLLLTGLRRAPATWKRRCASPRFVPQGGEGDALFKGEHCGSGKRDRWTQRDIRRARRHDLTRSCESGWVSATAGLGEKTCHVT